MTPASFTAGGVKNGQISPHPVPLPMGEGALLQTP